MVDLELDELAAVSGAGRRIGQWLGPATRATADLAYPFLRRAGLFVS